MEYRAPGIHPRPTLGRRLDAAFRRCFPALSTALALLLLAGPFGLPGQAELQPAVALASVFFWSLHRPGSMPAPVVFALGLLADLLGLMPVGVGVLALLIAHGVALRFRHDLARMGLVPVWLVFLGVAAGTATLEWALVSLLTLRLLSPVPLLFQFALTAGLYPALALALHRAHRGVADPGRA